MKINELLQYKVVEADKALAILHASDRLQRPGTLELIQSDMATCCEYLARYTRERAAGKHPQDAHDRALVGARVLKKSNLQNPGSVQ